MKNMWFQKSFRRLLVDMHINDKNDLFMRDFDPENYAEMMKLAKVDTAEIYAGSCLGLCYWPTKIGFQHQQLNGRDILGDAVNACVKRGITVQIYLNVWNRAAYDAHPEWRTVYHDGRHSMEYENMRFGLCCPNTGYGRFYLDLVEELVNSYECVGYWIDMISDFFRICYCPGCQERFRRETGFAELPRNVDWNDPAWNAFMAARGRWLADFAGNIVRTVKKHHPDRTVTFQSATLICGWKNDSSIEFAQAGDYLAGDFTGDQIEQAYVCKFYSALSKYRPMEFMTPRCENLEHHTTTRSPESLQMRAFASVANQAAFTLIDAIDPSGTLDRRFYELAGKINGSIIPYEKYIDGRSIPLVNAAVYYNPGREFSETSEPFNIADAEKVNVHEPWRRHLTKIFLDSHTQFTFASKADLGSLSRFPLIVLSDWARMDNQECDAFEKYVREGGKLYASLRSSLYDPAKGMRPDFGLADVFGVHYQGAPTPRLSYIAPADDSFLSEYCTKQYPLMLDGRQIQVSADPDTEILGTMALPFSTKEERVNFSSAISNPPMISTDCPALVRHPYGKGEVIFCAGRLEATPYDFQRGIFSGLLKRLLGKMRIETDLPKTAEVTVFDQPQQRRLVLSILNLPSELPAQPLFDRVVTLTLPEEYSVRQIKKAPEDTLQTFEQKDGAVTFHLKRLDQFVLFTLEY